MVKINRSIKVKISKGQNKLRVYKGQNTMILHMHIVQELCESRWTSWAVHPNEPSGFRGRKELLNRASALVTTCP